MHNSVNYKGYHLKYCVRSECWRWHIFIEIPGEPMLHVGPDDLLSLVAAKEHIDAVEADGMDRLEADLFGEHQTT